MDRTADNPSACESCIGRDKSKDEKTGANTDLQLGTVLEVESYKAI